MSDMPKLNPSTLFTYTEELQLCFRALHLEIFSSSSTPIFRVVFNESALIDKVIMGNRGWFYYNDIGSLNDYRRMSDIDSNLTRHIVSNFLVRQQWPSSRGIKFAILVPPNKERIYPDFMPKRIKIIDGLT